MSLSWARNAACLVHWWSMITKSVPVVSCTFFFSFFFFFSFGPTVDQMRWDNFPKKYLKIKDDGGKKKKRINRFQKEKRKKEKKEGIFFLSSGEFSPLTQISSISRVRSNSVQVFRKSWSEAPTKSLVTNYASRSNFGGYVGFSKKKPQKNG